MCNINSATIKKSTYVPVAVICFCCSSVLAQQNIIADKDNTHPEITIQAYSPAFITSFSAQRWNGYNEISWTTLREQDTRKYIVEYSTNGLTYQTAGEVLASNGSYTIKHQLLDPRPIIYRIKMEQANNKFAYGEGIAIDGINISPVQIYPTIIQGNTININAYWPVERVVITSGSGAQVYAKDINGQRDFMSVVIPSFGKGVYWMTFYGRGWKTTSKFIVA